MKNVIYQIRNLVNGKRYIGQSIVFNKRKSAHFSELRKGRHHSSHLQHSYNKYGKECFVIEIIDSVRYVEELDYREQYWIDRYDFDTELYNECPFAGRTIRGRKISEATRKKLSKASTGRIKSAKARRKAFRSNPNKKQIVQIDIDTGDTLAIFPGIKEADRITGVDFRNISAVCNEKGGRIATGGYGWTFATGNEIILDKYKNIIFKNKNVPRLVAQVDIKTDEIINLFDSPIHAARENGLHASHISTVCLGNRKTTGGYKWKYVDKETNEPL